MMVLTFLRFHVSISHHLATCEFCGQVYALNPKEVETLLEAKAKEQGASGGEK